MNTIKWAMVIVTGVLMLSACGGQTAEALPTLAPTGQPVQATTPTSIPTNAPTPTELQHATLPPTWTPQLKSTATSIPPTETAVPTIKPVATLAVCTSFIVDRERSPETFVVGQPVQVYWSAVDGASRYRIVVLDENSLEIFAGYAVDATFTFEPDQFEAGKRYIWTVYPEDGLRQQMCVGISWELSPR